jgi:hypothetical protein
MSFLGIPGLAAMLVTLCLLLSSEPPHNFLCSEPRQVAAGTQGKKELKNKNVSEMLHLCSRLRALCSRLTKHKINFKLSETHGANLQKQAGRVATSTIRRAWARPSVCRKPINKKSLVAGESSV